jgi:hypothetical protein
MLSEKKIPKSFWAEAVNWIIYVLNRCPTNVVKDMTLEEVWTGMKPSVEHFRVFGCVAYVHIPNARRTKLENKSVCCVLLGVSEESKGYRLYDPTTKKIVTSRDIIFEEEKHWDWDISYKEELQMNLEWGEEGETDADEANSSEDAEAIEQNIADSDAESNWNGIGESSNAPANTIYEEDVNLHPRRETSMPNWMRDYVSGEGLSEEETELNMAIVTSGDPVSYEEAVKSYKWREAMDAEMESIQKNETWSLTELPAGTKKIGVKWIYKTKLNESGKVDKLKARLVAKGYAQQHGVDYTEVFAPVARMDTVQMIIALAATKGWLIYQLDVKSAFLHGELIEDLFVEQPKGYE